MKSINEKIKEQEAILSELYTERAERLQALLQAEIEDFDWELVDFSHKDHTLRCPVPEHLKDAEGLTVNVGKIMVHVYEGLLVAKIPDGEHLPFTFGKKIKEIGQSMSDRFHKLVKMGNPSDEAEDESKS